LREITHDGVREQYKTELLARFEPLKLLINALFMPI